MRGDYDDALGLGGFLRKGLILDQGIAGHQHEMKDTTRCGRKSVVFQPIEAAQQYDRTKSMRDRSIRGLDG